MPRFLQDKRDVNVNLFLHQPGSALYRIWFSLNKHEFMPLINQIRLIRLKQDHPHASITLVYCGHILTRRARQALRTFCESHDIQYKDIDTWLPSRLNYLHQKSLASGNTSEAFKMATLDKRLFYIASKEIALAVTGRRYAGGTVGNIAAAADIFRLLHPLALLGCYSDHDERVVLSKYLFEHEGPVILNNFGRYLSNNIILLAQDPTSSTTKLHPLSERWLYLCKRFIYDSFFNPSNLNNFSNIYAEIYSLAEENSEAAAEADSLDDWLDVIILVVASQLCLTITPLTVYSYRQAILKLDRESMHLLLLEGMLENSHTRKKLENHSVIVNKAMKDVYAKEDLNTLIHNISSIFGRYNYFKNTINRLYLKSILNIAGPVGISIAMTQNEEMFKIIPDCRGKAGYKWLADNKCFPIHRDNTSEEGYTNYNDFSWTSKSRLPEIDMELRKAARRIWFAYSLFQVTRSNSILTGQAQNKDSDLVLQTLVDRPDTLLRLATAIFIQFYLHAFMMAQADAPQKELIFKQLLWLWDIIVCSNYDKVKPLGLWKQIVNKSMFLHDPVGGPGDEYRIFGRKLCSFFSTEPELISVPELRSSPKPS